MAIRSSAKHRWTLPRPEDGSGYSLQPSAIHARSQYQLLRSKPEEGVLRPGWIRLSLQRTSDNPDGPSCRHGVRIYPK